ncbi:hypothetical protein EVJ50_01455 [Synechococcus sp. RSCCF101]|nr:hypothetical protein EVJ50_01455 [Synechococcus sp. RSCCF101]
MRTLCFMAFFMAAVFVLGETSRRGLDYFSVNATTMIEDYLCAILLLLAGFLTWRRHRLAPTMMLAAWAYATGGMLVPFAAHLEASLRGITFRADHPHEDVGSVVLKGVIWLICLVCFLASLRLGDSDPTLRS